MNGLLLLVQVFHYHYIHSVNLAVVVVVFGSLSFSPLQRKGNERKGVACLLSLLHSLTLLSLYLILSPFPYLSLSIYKSSSRRRRHWSYFSKRVCLASDDKTLQDIALNIGNSTIYHQFIIKGKFPPPMTMDASGDRSRSCQLHYYHFQFNRRNKKYLLITVYSKNLTND